jgi:hypothetical protein
MESSRHDFYEIKHSNSTGLFGSLETFRYPIPRTAQREPSRFCVWHHQIMRTFPRSRTRLPRTRRWMLLLSSGTNRPQSSERNDVMPSIFYLHMTPRWHYGISIAFSIHHDINKVTSWAMPGCDMFHDVDGSVMRNTVFLFPRMGIVLVERFSEQDSERSLVYCLRH